LDKSGTYMCVCVHISSSMYLYTYTHTHRRLQNRLRIDPESLDSIKDKSLGALGSGGLAFNNNPLLEAKFKASFRSP